MVHYITLYSFLIRKEKNIHGKLCLTINNWKQGIYQDEYNGLCYYKNDEFYGPYYRWYDNGQLDVKYYYKNDKLHGPWYQWYDNGKLCEKRYYNNDKLHGKYKEWDEQGNLIENSIYNNGIKIEN